MAALEKTAGQFLDTEAAARRQAISEVSARSGFSGPIVAQALDWTFSEITIGQMRRLLISELGSDDVADDPALRSPELTFLIAAGAIFQPAVNGVVFSLLIKSPIAVKCSSHEPVLLPLFVRTLRGIDPGVGSAAEAALLAHDRVDQLLSKADAVIAYGSDETISLIRSRMFPSPRRGEGEGEGQRKKFIGYGHKTSLAVVGSGSLRKNIDARAAARGLALDVAMYDQSGCLSPQCVYVESGAKTGPEEFAGMLAGELATLTKSLPPGPLGIEQAGAIQSFRGEFEFQGGPVFFGDRLSYTIVVDRDPAFRPSPLGRTILVKPVEKIFDLPVFLKSVEGHLQAVGATPVDDIQDMINPLRALGASYFCPLGQMQRPPLAWQNAGVPCLRSLLNV